MRTLVPDANTGNRISIQGDDVVIGLDDYKTIGTHGPQVFTISTDANLVRELRRLLEHRKPGDPLLFGQDSVPFPPSAFTHLMTKSLSDEVGKHVTVQIARKILAKASWLENPSRNAMEHISRYDFHHYLVTHLSYNQYHPGTETADGDALSDPSDEPLELAEHVGTPGSFDIAGLAASFEGDDARSLVAPPSVVQEATHTWVAEQIGSQEPPGDSLGRNSETASQLSHIYFEECVLYVCKSL